MPLKTGKVALGSSIDNFPKDGIILLGGLPTRLEQQSLVSRLTPSGAVGGHGGGGDDGIDGQSLSAQQTVGGVIEVSSLSSSDESEESSVSDTTEKRDGGTGDDGVDARSFSTSAFFCIQHCFSLTCQHSISTLFSRRSHLLNHISDKGGGSKMVLPCLLHSEGP